MEVKETNTDGLKRSYKVIIGSADLEERVQQKLGQLSAQASLPGFRPGKVPPKVLRARFGKSVFGEVLQETIDESAKNTLEKNEIKPALQPKIEVVKDFEEGKDLQYTIDVEVLPKIIPVDANTIELEQLISKPSDQDVDDAIDSLAHQQRTFEGAGEGVAAKNDYAVVMDFVGKIAGNPFEGGSANDTQLVLGSGQFIPGFEEKLLGSRAGDEKEVSVTFPEDYQNEQLRGKDAVFDVKVKEVKKPNKPKVDDELAKAMGLDGLSSLREKVGEQIQKEFDTVSRSRLKKLLLDELNSLHDFDLPPTLVENEFTAIWGQVQRDLEQGRLGEEDKDKDKEQLQQEYKTIAERRVRLGLLLSEVGQSNNIKVDQGEVSRAIQTQAQRFPGQEQQVFNYFQNNPDASVQLQAPIFEDKVVDFILELAKVTERQVTRAILFDEGSDNKAESSEKKLKKKASGKKKVKGKTVIKQSSAKRKTASRKV